MSKAISNSAQRAVTKFDLRKHLYNPSAKETVIVDVPDMQFLMVDGTGNPNTSQVYQEAAGDTFPYCNVIAPVELIFIGTLVNGVLVGPPTTAALLAGSNSAP